MKSKAIKVELKKNGIYLNSEPQAHLMQESLTNNYLKAKDRQEKGYLVRLNGKLWPPFTRKNEDCNLKKLSLNKIDTSVIANNFEQGFQICLDHDPDQNFIHQLNTESKYFRLKQFSVLVRKYHDLKNFNNDFSLIQTLLSSFAILSEKNKKNISLFYPLIISILDTLNSDMDNLVSSHNDLLPSSIYVKKNGLSIVDWEYSGKNHRSYDLAHFSIKSNLKEIDEKILIKYYDSENSYDTEYFFFLIKPYITLLLMQWNLASENSDMILNSTLEFKLYASFQKILFFNAVYTLMPSCRLCRTQKKAADSENNKTIDNIQLKFK